MRKFFLVLFLAFTFAGKSQGLLVFSQCNYIVSNFRHLSLQELSDTANHYFLNNDFETALSLYSLLISTTPQNASVEHLRRVAWAYHRAATIYSQHSSNYRTAYELWIRALLLSEEIGYYAFIPRVLTSIGFVYSRFGRQSIGHQYYHRALELWTEDSILLIAILNNLGATEPDRDSAFYFLNRALELSKQLDNRLLSSILHSLAVYYEQNNILDSAHHYFRLLLDKAEEQDNMDLKSKGLLGLGRLFLLENQTDSALHFVNLSMALATEHNLLEALMDNYLFLSRIERTEGRWQSAYEFLEKHLHLRDSLFGAEKLAEVNQLQRLYETTRINRHLEQLAIETRIKERTIHLQQIILFILVLMVLYSVFVFYQKKKLDTAYKVLFDKNIEIVELQKKSSDSSSSKRISKKILAEDTQEKLLNNILALMEDPDVVYDPDLSVDKLAVLLQSNSTYISQIINTTLKKNFRSFVNDYRIKEAQRLFATPDMSKYTIETVAQKVGFKSRNTFYEAFKEITGVSPSFYLKSLQNTSH